MPTTQTRTIITPAGVDASGTIYVSDDSGAILAYRATAEICYNSSDNYSGAIIGNAVGLNQVTALAVH